MVSDGIAGGGAVWRSSSALVSINEVNLHVHPAR